MAIEISDKRLRFAYWYANRRATFGRIFVPVSFLFGALIVVMLATAALLLFQLWGTVTTHASRSVTLHDAFASFATARAPLPLGVSSLEFVADEGAQQGSYVVEITNNNVSWGAPKVGYTFSFGESETKGESFVVPGMSTYIVVQADRVGNASFALNAIVWQRSRAGVVVVPDFPVVSTEFVPRVPTGNSTLSLARVSATVRNATSDDYWEAPFAILLLSSDDAILGLRLVTVKDFNAGDTATIAATWTGSYANVRNIAIVPQINIYDASLKKQKSGAVGESK